MARLFLKKPKKCIFDEATSFLDRDTELKIQNNIRDFLPHMTKIIITHRPFMLDHADQMITLKNTESYQDNKREIARKQRFAINKASMHQGYYNQ